MYHINTESANSEVSQCLPHGFALYLHFLGYHEERNRHHHHVGRAIIEKQFQLFGGTVGSSRHTAKAEERHQITDYEHIVVDLKDGFTPPAIPKITDKDEYAGLTETEFNRFVFRVPLLEDAIRHERYFSDSIGFWRRIAMDCLLAVQRVDENGEVLDTLPKEFHTWYGLKIFNEYLSGKDLRNIRNELIEYLPTLPFAYYEPCGCDEQREIPMVMEVSNFFSE